MADRYWVGGTASWDGTAGTKWAATSGGPGGETVPTSADDVFFSASSTGTVTIATGNTGAKSINCTGFTGTLTGTADITVSGNITLVAGMTYSHTGTVTINATATLTTAGKAFSGLVVSGTGITVTLGDALSISNRTIIVSNGTFDTANYSVTAGSLNSTGTSSRTIKLGTSTVTLSGGIGISFGANNLTFDAGTSQVNLTSSSGTLAASHTFYNVTFTSRTGGTNVRAISGSNTFNNLTSNAIGAGSTLIQLSINANQTVSGTFDCSGANATNRAFIQSNAPGTAYTITANSILANYCDFRDITLAGAAANAAPTGAGDCGGNSGITFPAAKTVYRVGTDTTWVGSSSWALSSGGSGSNANFPLAQDTIVINNDTTLTGTLKLALYNIGTLDCSNRTTGISVDHNTGAYRYGSYTLGSGVSIVGTSRQDFYGRGTMDFTSAGKTITFPIEVNAPGGTFRLGDAFNATNTFTVTRGTFTANDYNFTCLRFNSSGANTRTISMGSGLWTLTGTGTVVDMISTGRTFNKNTANILLSDTSSTSRLFLGGANTSFNKLTIGGATGTSATTFGSSNMSFTELASTKTVAHTITFGGNHGTIDVWSATGTAGNVVTVNSNSPGTRRTFTLTNVTSGIDYLNVTDIGELSGNKFYVGANSTNGGNNSNVYFTAPPATATGNMFMLF